MRVIIEFKNLNGIRNKEYINMKKRIFLLLMFFLIQSFAQDEKFIQSKRLPSGWEYYQITLMNSIAISLPVLKVRTDFLAEKCTLDLPEEAGKYIWRYSFKSNNQSYIYLIAYRGAIRGISDKNENELEKIIKKEFTVVLLGEMAQQLAGVNGEKNSLKDLTYKMDNAASETKYYINNNSLFLLDFTGSQKKEDLQNGKDYSSEIEKNIAVIATHYLIERKK